MSQTANKVWDQYKEAVCILIEELTATDAKLKEESHLREEAEKAKADLATELTTLRGQVDKVKADTVAEFQVSQPFLDAGGNYYGVGFDNFLKQVESVYPDLDLSRITINDTVPPTTRGDDTISEESDDSTHTMEQESKDDDVVITQPVLEGLVAPIVPSLKYIPLLRLVLILTHNSCFQKIKMHTLINALSIFY